MSISLLAGIVLVLIAVLFNLAFFALASTFEYPAILRQPTEVLLRKFSEGGRRLATLWYVFGLTALLSIPMALLVMAVFIAQNPTLSFVSGLLGTLSGLVQALGLLRWAFLVPLLAARHQAPGASAATRDAVQVVFEAFHQYVGVAVGEHLGYLFTAGWTFAVCGLMAGAPLFSPLLVGLGVLSAAGILAGLLEPSGWKPAGAINATAYLVWSGWLVLTGLTLIFAR